MQQISIKEVLSEAVWLYRESISALFKLVIPIIVVTQLIDVTSEFLPKFLTVIAVIFSMLASSFANALSVKTMYGVFFKSKINEIRPIEFLWYLLSSGYLMFAFSLTASIFILAIPALLLFVVTALSPIFIFEHGEGPIQAIASSCECIRGNIFKSAAIMLSYCVVIFIVFGALTYLASHAGILSKPLGYLVSVLFCVLWLYHSAVIVVLYRKFHPNKSLKDAP
jgi:hypothetical protein